MACAFTYIFVHAKATNLLFAFFTLKYFNLIFKAQLRLPVIRVQKFYCHVKQEADSGELFWVEKEVGIMQGGQTDRQTDRQVSK